MTLPEYGDDRKDRTTFDFVEGYRGLDYSSDRASHRYDIDGQGRLVSIWTPLDPNLNSKITVIDNPSEELYHRVRVEKEVALLSTRVVEDERMLDQSLEEITDLAILSELGIHPDQLS